MADTKQTTVTFLFDDQVSKGADAAAESVESLRDRMASGQAAAKQLQSQLKNLRGTTDEVTAAKGELRAKLAAEKDALTGVQLALLKQSDAVKALDAAKRKAAADAVSNAEAEAKAKIKHDKDQAGATAFMADLKKKIDADALVKSKLVETQRLELVKRGETAEKKRLEGLKEKLGENAQALDATKAAMLGMAAAAAVAATAVAGVVVALSKWILVTADAERKSNLFRQAAAGSAVNAENLGNQIDVLADKVPTSRAALNDLGNTLARNGVQGQTLVDTLNAVAQASAAGADAAKLQSLVERGRVTKRFSVDPNELQGTGLQITDLADSLAKNMGIGVKKAQMALRSGAVSLGDGAKAMRDAVEKKFGNINLQGMLSLDTILLKAKERLESFMRALGPSLQPALMAVSDLFSLLDDRTVTGSAVKELLVMLGKGLASTVTGSAPIVKRFFQGMIIAGLQVTLGILKLRNQFRKTFGKDVKSDIDGVALALEAGKFVVLSLAAGVATLAAGVAIAAYPFVKLGKAVYGLGKGVLEAVKWFKTIDWAATGVAIVDGIIGGIKSKFTDAVDTVKSLGEKIKGAFTGRLKIQSPSKVFAEYGENTVEGFNQGVESRTPDAARALDGVGNAPPAGGGGRGAVSISMPVNITVPNAQAAADLAANPDFVAQLTKALEQVLVANGIPVS